MKRATQRAVRMEPLSAAERALLASAEYEGSPHHKRHPGDFQLIPPTAPRPDKTLCDEAGVDTKAEAEALFARALERGLVSEATVPEGFPKQIWLVDGNGQVFEAMHGGSRAGRYHGYPIRRSDTLFARITKAWGGG